MDFPARTQAARQADWEKAGCILRDREQGIHRGAMEPRICDAEHGVPRVAPVANLRSSVPLRQAAFLGVHEVEEGDEILAVAEAGLLALLHETGGGGVAPAALGHEAVE